MRRVWAIASLTFWEGVRMKIVLVFIVVLVFVVLRLPFALRGDETLAGRLQTFLAYSLGAVSVFLGLATVFLSCATLTQEIKNRSLHLVVTKPVSRLEILAGKWLGVNLLNVALLGLCGVTIYGFAVFIKNRPETFRRDMINIRDVIWTAREAASPVVPDFAYIARQIVEERKARDPQSLPQGEEAAIAELVREMKDSWLRLRPGENRLYEFQGLLPPEREDAAYQVRFKARATPTPADEMLDLAWMFVDPESRAPLMEPFPTSKRIHEMHQFLVRARPVVREGRAALVVFHPPNPQKRINIFFETREDLKIMYKVGSFEANYLKALLLVFLRLAFLSALGLFFGTFVSFPVACFCVLSLFVFCVGVPWWLEAMGAHLEYRDDKIDPYGRYGPYIRPVLVPLLKVALPSFVKYDGGGPLIDGFYIRPELLGQAAAHTLIYGILLLALPGWLIFRSRELADVQV